MKKIGLISLSNGLKENQQKIICDLENKLNVLGIEVKQSSTIFSKNSISASGKERCTELIKLYLDNSIDAIFDVSGGDLANEVLLYLDFEVIKNNPKPFWGYSDLSVIINSIYSQTNEKSYWYQIRNIISNESSFNNFKNFIENNNTEIFNFNYRWLQGYSMAGIVVGGNIRCTLKLAGTKFIPDFKDKILFIESFSGNISKITTLLTQYKLMGVFDEISGVILGQFTELEKDNSALYVDNLITSIIDKPELPIIKTDELGHSSNSKSLIIGEFFSAKY